MLFIDVDDELIMPKTDLNLVVIFDAIMQEQSVTTAAERLAMTQPSVSNALARMRHVWRDPLFVKDGRGVKPTPYAQRLWAQIAHPLSDIRTAVDPPQFDPASHARCFRIALTDGLTGMFWSPLRQHIEHYAPNIDVHAVPYTGALEQQLMQANVDLVMGHYFGRHQQIATRALFENPFVVVMRPNHPLSQGKLTLKRFIAAEQLLVSLSGDAEGSVDITLAEMGLKRRLAMTLNTFAGAVELVQDTNLITVLPYPVVAKYLQRGELLAKPTPISIPTPIMYMAWHKRDERDPGLQWMRNVIQTISEDIQQSCGELHLVSS